MFETPLNNISRWIKPIITTTSKSHEREYRIPYDDEICVGTAYVYLVLGRPQKAVDILTDMAELYLSQACWFLSMDNQSLRKSKSACKYAFDVVDDVFSVLQECIEEDQFKQLVAQLVSLRNEFDRRVK